MRLVIFSRIWVQPYEAKGLEYLTAAKYNKDVIKKGMENCEIDVFFKTDKNLIYIWYIQKIKW